MCIRDRYLGVNSEYQKMAYFELATWDENELKTVRDFAHGYFFTPNPKVEQRLKERWENGEMFAKSILNPKKLKNRKMRTLNATSKHDDPQKEVLAQGAAMSKVNTKSLINFYREGYNSGVFKEGEVISLLERHLLRLGDQGGIKRNMSLQSVSAQFEAVIDLVHAINPSERPADAIALQGLLINMVAQNDVPIELPAFTEINMAKKSMVSALINRGMELCPDIPTKDYPMTKEAGSRHLNIGAFDALDKGLQANFSRVANEYLESMQSFSPPMPDLSHLSLTSSGPLAALHLINRSQVFEGVVDENAFDYANDMSKMCIGDNLSRKNNGEIESLALSLMRSTTPIQFNIRELLAELYPSEATIALSMVNDGVLEEWGVSENSVKDFVASFKEENIVSDYTKEHLSNVDSLEEVMNYLQNVAKGRDSLGYSNLRFTREDGSMSPLTALISLAYEHGSNVDDNAIHKAFRNVDFFSDYGIRNASYEQMEYGDRWRASLLTAGRENTATRENNPYNQWMLSQYCPVEAARMGNGDIPFVKTLSNDGEQMMKTAMVNTLIDAGKHKKTMYLNQDARVPVVSNRIYDISTRRMNVVAYKGDSKHELDLLSLESVLFACRDEQRANEAPSNELHYLYSRTRKPSEECVSLVEDWVRDLGMPQESALVLQGTQMFDSFDYSYAKEMVLDSRVISKLGDAMKLHGVEVGNYGQDMRDYTLAIEPIEALEVKVDRGGEPSPQTVSPTRSSEPLEAKEKVGEGEKNTPSVKKDDLMEVNRDVPVVDDDGVFRKVNQMSFF